MEELLAGVTQIGGRAGKQKHSDPGHCVGLGKHPVPMEAGWHPQKPHPSLLQMHPWTLNTQGLSLRIPPCFFDPIHLYAEKGPTAALADPTPLPMVGGQGGPSPSPAGVINNREKKPSLGVSPPWG